MNIYTSIEYNSIKYQSMIPPPIVQNNLFWTVMSLFKAGYDISCYISYTMKAYQRHSNFLIIKKNHLVKLW